MRIALSLIIALTIALFGFRFFQNVWAHSDKAFMLATTLGISKTSLVMTASLLGCVVGFYSMYRWSLRAVDYSCAIIIESLNNKQQTTVNSSYLKYNWILPLSASAFWALHFSLTTSFFISFVLSIAIITFLSSNLPPLIEYIKKTRLDIQAVSFLTACGVCACRCSIFYSRYNYQSKFQYVESLLPLKFNLLLVVSAFISIISVFFIFLCTIYFWNQCFGIFKRSSLLNGIQGKEIVIYGFLLALSIVYMASVFYKANAFYGYSVQIYTSDSGWLMTENCYLNLTHCENDLRQPLFAFFASPFVGIPYLISVVFHVPPSVRAMLENSVQIFMLFMGNLTLTRMMKLNSIKRVCFMLLSSVTYTQLLFILMMEQYIVAYFWLILCLYLIEEKKTPNRLAFWGASGTMLSSAILLPLMSKKSPLVTPRTWFKDIFSHGFQFILLITVFCRFDIFLDFFSKIAYYQRYTGVHVSFQEKAFQYSAFIKNVLFAPNHMIAFNRFNIISWQLPQANNVDIFGVVILITVLLSVLWNRDKKSSLLAFGWLVYSIVFLLFIGWGTSENGLILYSLYFGWPLLVLLFQFVEKLEEKLKTCFLTPISTALAFFALILHNAPGISELIRFAIDNCSV